MHRLENIHKIVSGIDKESLEIIKAVYDIVIEVGTYLVPSMLKISPGIQAVLIDVKGILHREDYFADKDIL